MRSEVMITAEEELSKSNCAQLCALMCLEERSGYSQVGSGLGLGLELTPRQPGVD